MMVLVGQRKAAIEAARRFGWPFVVVTNQSVTNRPRANVFVCAFEKAALHACAIELQRRGDIVAVIPVTESAVLAAAWLRQSLGVPGDSVATAVQCTDKYEMKKMLKGNRIACADFALGSDYLPKYQTREQLGWPRVIKLRIGSGGRGMRVVHDPAQWPDQLDDNWLVEKWVSGSEYSVESLVCDGKVIFHNVTNYVMPRWANLLPAKFTEDQLNPLLQINQQVITQAGITKGITHLELFLTESGWVVGEIAARAPGGHLMELMSMAYGVDMWHQVFRIFLGENLAEVKSVVDCYGVLVLHPGEGTIVEIVGADQARRIPGVLKCLLTVSSGDHVGPRLGSGQETGYIVARGANEGDVKTSLMLARDAIYWDMS